MIKSRFLFVYGTLRQGHVAGKRYIEDLGGTYLTTNCFAKGKRHGAIVATFDNESKDTCDGHLVVLPEDGTKILEVLDTYEGMNHKNPDDGAYKRVIADVIIPGHDFIIEAYAYHYNHVR